METTMLIIIIVLLVLFVVYLYGLNYIYEAELELKDLEIEHLEAHKKFHEDSFFKLEEEKHKC